MGITEIAGYRVIRALGAGGMGEVFLVQHPRLPRQDALKLLDTGISRNDEFKARFQREADLLAQLNHPNIVTLHDRGEFDSRLWITMEYVDGTDAAELLKAGPLDAELALSLTAAAGAALDYAWRKHRITHRDVKPANILVAIDQTDGVSQIEAVKLADFGIAKAAGESTSLTTTGMTIGTMQYISPEAIEGEAVDNRADIYSLGCTAFHLLAGQPPFTGTTIASTMSAHLTKPVPSISAVNPRLPHKADAVFERVLAKNPDDRYQSCAEFVTALQEAIGAGDVRYPASAPTLAAARPMASERRSVTTKWLAVAAAVAAVAISVVALTRPWQHRSDQSNAMPATIATVSSSAPSIPSDSTSTIPPVTVSSPSPAPVLSRPKFADSPTRLQFDDPNLLQALAVDKVGNLFIGDWSPQGGRLLKLAAGETTPTVLPVTGLGGLCGITVSNSGDIYALDSCSNAGSTLLKIPAGASTPIQLSPVLRAGAKDIAVDKDDNLYLICSNRFGVWVNKLAPGTTTPIELPHTGLDYPTALAVDAENNLYLGGDNGKVVKYPAGSNAPVALPFNDVSSQGRVSRITVDRAGTVYRLITVFSESTGTSSATSSVDALPIGETASIALNFEDMLAQSDGIAVDDSGVYVISDGNGINQPGYMLLLRRTQ